MDQLIGAIDPSSGPPIIVLIIAVTGVLKQAICGDNAALSNRFGRLIALVTALVLCSLYELYQGSGIYRDAVATIVDALIAMGVVYGVKRAPGVYAAVSEATTTKKAPDAQD